MPVILPFRAFHSRDPALYIPGEEQPVPLGELTQSETPALFHYRQQFTPPGELGESVRDGIMGLLNRAEAIVFPHEETFPNRVAACASSIERADTDPGSLWLWCNQAHFELPTAPPQFEALDSFGCLHQLWSITDAARIEALQFALARKPLFLVDGHHRFAAGWNLATIQTRSCALRTRPVHRLILEDCDLSLPETQPVVNIEAYLASSDRHRIIVTPGLLFRGFVIPHSHYFSYLPTQPVRDISQAIEALQNGQAPMAVLAPALSLDAIEQDATRGTLLPPKSTDFFPKLAAGLVLHRPESTPHQNENVTPPTAQRPGVRNASS